MRLWTIQSPAAFEVLERNGVLRGAPERNGDEYFGRAYAWMRRRLIERVGPPPEPDAAMLGAWVQWSGAARRRPDQRSSGFQRPGTGLVRIEFDIDEASILQSDFGSWHAVLNNWYLAYEETELDAFVGELDARGLRPSAGPLPDPGFQATVERTWDRVFDLETSEFIGGPIEQRSIQAVFWALRWEQVRAVKRFRCR